LSSKMEVDSFEKEHSFGNRSPRRSAPRDDINYEHVAQAQRAPVGCSSLCRISKRAGELHSRGGFNLSPTSRAVFRAKLRCRCVFVLVSSRCGSRAVVGAEPGKLLARQILAEPAVLDPFILTAADEVAVGVQLRDTSGTLARIVGALAAVVPAKTCKRIAHAGILRLPE
jgi:hypothetical protein